MSAQPTSTPTTAEPNPLANAITSYIGSANFQKTLAGLQVAIAALTSAEGSGLGMKIAGMSVGGLYGLGVHYVDYLRAKIGR